MNRFWTRGEPATVREILTDLASERQLAGERELAYTTVLTVVDNLFKKGWLRREPAGRAHRYQPTASRGEYGARLMRQALTESGDARQALLAFVGDMSADEAAAVRAALATYDNAHDTGEAGA